MLSLKSLAAVLFGLSLAVMAAFGFYAGLVFLGEAIVFLQALVFLRRVGRVLRWMRA